MLAKVLIVETSWTSHCQARRHSLLVFVASQRLFTPLYVGQFHLHNATLHFGYSDVTEPRVAANYSAIELIRISPSPGKYIRMCMKKKRVYQVAQFKREKRLVLNVVLSNSTILSHQGWESALYRT